MYQNKAAPLEIRPNLMYHLRQCKGGFQVIFSFDITAAVQGMITFGDGLALYNGQGRLILDREGKSGHLWVMEWALGLTDDLFWPDRICDVPGSVKIMQKYPDLEALMNAAELRSRRQLLDEADLIYRLHWACVDARVMGLPAPWGVDAGVVMERHRALFWLAGCDGMCPWDDVDLST